MTNPEKKQYEAGRHSMSFSRQEDQEAAGQSLAGREQAVPPAETNGHSTNSSRRHVHTNCVVRGFHERRRWPRDSGSRETLQVETKNEIPTHPRRVASRLLKPQRRSYVRLDQVSKSNESRYVGGRLQHRLEVYFYHVSTDGVTAPHLAGRDSYELG